MVSGVHILLFLGLGSLGLSLAMFPEWCGSVDLGCCGYCKRQRRGCGEARSSIGASFFGIPGGFPVLASGGSLSVWSVPMAWSHGFFCASAGAGVCRSARISFLRRGSGDCYGDGTSAAGQRLVVATILGIRVGGLHPNLGVLLVGMLELMRRGVRLLHHRRSDGHRPFSRPVRSAIYWHVGLSGVLLLGPVQTLLLLRGMVVGCRLSRPAACE